MRISLKNDRTSMPRVLAGQQPVGRSKRPFAGYAKPVKLPSGRGFYPARVRGYRGMFKTASFSPETHAGSDGTWPLILGA